MKRLILVALASVAIVGLTPKPAAADLTAFFGASPTTKTRGASGLALGLHTIFIGFEFEYAHLNEDIGTSTPGVGTAMFNLMLSTPTKTQVYVTAGGGPSHENLAEANRWGFATNIGGGVKITLVGPVRLRVDYRVFTMHRAISGVDNKPQQRIYAGLNVAF